MVSDSISIQLPSTIRSAYIYVPNRTYRIINVLVIIILLGVDIVCPLKLKSGYPFQSTLTVWITVKNNKRSYLPEADAVDAVSSGILIEGQRDNPKLKSLLRCRTTNQQNPLKASLLARLNRGKKGILLPLKLERGRLRLKGPQQEHL